MIYYNFYSGESMNKIEVKKLILKDKRITVQFDVSGSDEWKGYFAKPYEMYAEYNFSVEDIPYSVAIIPFVSDFLPMLWLCDASLTVDELDKAYYESIPEFRNGFKNMHPKFDCKGTLNVNKIVENHSVVPAERSAAFFSGGVDATNTLISHIDEKPVMITLWGADMPVDNSEGWQTIYNHVTKASSVFGLELQTVKTSCKSVLNIAALNAMIERKEFGANWYEHFYYGIAFFGQVAPLAYKIGLKTIYLASTNSPDDIGKYTCGSDPTIDDFIRFVDCSAVHDSFAVNRQKKVRNICNYRKKSGIASPLRVCWKSKDAVNCCVCEKCCRTMLGIMVEDENPADYGFPYYNEAVRTQMLNNLKKKYKIQYHFVYYKPIQTVLREKYTYRECPADLKWIYKLKFKDPNPAFFRAYAFASGIAHKALKLMHINLSNDWQKIEKQNEKSE